MNAILFDVRVHNAWSYDQLPMVQRIMDTVEKTTTGITPAELIFNNYIRLSSHILAAPATRDRSSLLALSDTMDSWIEKQYTLLQAARAQKVISFACGIACLDFDVFDAKNIKFYFILIVAFDKHSRCGNSRYHS